MASTVGILSKGIKLGYKSTGSTYTFLDNLQEIPDLGQAPEQVDVTCLADSNMRYINGLVDFGSLEFTFLYDATVFNSLRTLETAGAAVDWEIELSDGATFTWSGTPSVSLSGASVNGALQFKLSISVSSNMTFTPTV